MTIFPDMLRLLDILYWDSTGSVRVLYLQSLVVFSLESPIHAMRNTWDQHPSAGWLKNETTKLCLVVLFDWFPLAKNTANRRYQVAPGHHRFEGVACLPKVFTTINQESVYESKTGNQGVRDFAGFKVTHDRCECQFIHRCNHDMK